MIDPMRCADFISYRIRLGLTLRQLSKRTGLSPATLHRLESRKSCLSPRSRIKLQDGLNLTPLALEHLFQKASAIRERTYRSFPDAGSAYQSAD